MGDGVASATALDRLVRLIVRIAKKVLVRFPQLVLRFLEIALNPAGHLRQLALVLGVQISSFLLQRLRNQMRRGILLENKDERALDAAVTYAEFRACENRIEQSKAPPPPLGNEDFFAQLQQRATNYARLQAVGDEYGLMFHLRSELMRKQAGGAGYSRDGSTWLRKHRAARERIEEYQQQVCSALRFIASGSAPGSSRPAQRLAFINETRHAFGRTALLLSGGAAFGVKHLGVVSALQRERLLPRIIAGTSAGSIVAAAVCSRRDDELTELIEVTGPKMLESLKFFGLKRGESTAELQRLSSSSDVRRTSEQPSFVDWDLRRHFKRQQEGKTMLGEGGGLHSLASTAARFHSRALPQPRFHSLVSTASLPQPRAPTAARFHSCALPPPTACSGRPLAPCSYPASWHTLRLVSSQTTTSSRRRCSALSDTSPSSRRSIGRGACSTSR